jgi:hypothetical protein
MEGHVKLPVLLAVAFAVLLTAPVTAQVSDADLASLPRFRQLQIRIEPVDSGFSVPGRWIAATSAMGENTEAIRTRYTELALRAGLVPLPSESLSTVGLFRAMGVFRREELLRTATETLQRIRGNLQNDTARVRFDFLFRPNGRWQVDIHDVALTRARRPFPTLTWESLRPALVIIGLRGNDPGVETIPLALYRLYIQSHNDSAGYQSTLDRLRQRDAPGATLVTAMVSSYREAAEWYVTAMRFLLEQRWIPSGTSFASPAEQVRAAWGQAAPIPEIRARPFGYPEGAVRIGTDSGLVRTLVIPVNAPAREWLKRNGWENLLAVTHRLVVEWSELARLKVGTAIFRLSSVREYAAESFSGFLEPRDIILLDPSYQPLFALGTLVHEWQHILSERSRQGDPNGGAYRIGGDQAVFAPLNPFLAEGFAEWLTEVILESTAADFPLVSLGETEKRLSLAQNDPHHLGYLLARSLARTLGSSAATRQLLIRAGANPALVLRDPKVRSAWSTYRGRDQTMTRRAEAVLLPMVTFTIEDDEPDLVQSQIIAPYIPRP